MWPYSVCGVWWGSQTGSTTMWKNSFSDFSVLYSCYFEFVDLKKNKKKKTLVSILIKVNKEKNPQMLIDTKGWCLWCFTGGGLFP